MMNLLCLVGDCDPQGSCNFRIIRSMADIMKDISTDKKKILHSYRAKYDNY